MAKSTKINVMISSPCESLIAYQGRSQPLTVVREELKRSLEGFRLPHQKTPLFRCWINEAGEAGAGSQTWWEHCLSQARDADFVIVLYTGSAGGSLNGDDDIGICHAELFEAMKVASGRVRVIMLPVAVALDASQRNRDLSFSRYFDTLKQFRTTANTGEELLKRVWEEVNSVVVNLVQTGSSSFYLSQASTGQALDWHRLSYAERKSEMEKALTVSLVSRTPTGASSSGVFVNINNVKVFVKPHASPASLSVPAARELVGQPFLRDYELYSELERHKAGPIHIVACPKGITETQAMSMLGFPDATIISDSFGIHIADKIHNIQVVLLKECVSSSAIKTQLLTWLEFLNRTGEARFVVERAKRRFKIVQVIAKESASMMS